MRGSEILNCSRCFSPLSLGAVEESQLKSVMQIFSSPSRKEIFSLVERRMGICGKANLKAKRVWANFLSDNGYFIYFRPSAVFILGMDKEN